MVGAWDVINTILQHTRLKFNLEKIWSCTLNEAAEALSGRAVSAATGVPSLGCVSQGKRAAFLSQTLHTTI